MGFQQLLLLTLSLIIVMLAVVVGIDAFQENRQRFEADQLVNDAVRLAAEAQAWYIRPTVAGGGNGASWMDVSFAHMGFATTAAGHYRSRNGTFQLEPHDRYLHLVGVDSTAGVTVTARVDGLNPENIRLDVDRWRSIRFQ